MTETLKNKTIRFFATAMGGFIAVLPRRIQLMFGMVIGILWFDLLRIRRNVALKNLEIAFPDLSYEERVRLARLSLVNVGQTIVEEILMLRFPAEKAGDYFVFEGLEILDRAFHKGKGVLLLTLHLGNGDFGCLGMALKGYRLHMISKQFKSKWINDLWFGVRKKWGTQFINAEKSSFEILRALKKNEGVIFVLDQFMGPPVGAKTVFFGKETGTAMGLAVIAERTKAPVIPCYTLRRDDGRLQVVFESEVQFDETQNIAFMTQVYTDKIEDIVRRFPSQWMWIHRRWKEFG